ncbi:MAG: hypothetical protein IKN38_04055 [Clostridia bacterium]|nr:hypothetical protein [Clostridia bacterium]
MSKKKGGRKLPLFYIIYFSVITVFIFALFFALQLIRVKLTEYEASRPYHYIDKIMEEYFEPGDAETLIDVSGCQFSEFEKREDVVAFIEGFLDDDPEYFSIASANSDELKYGIRSGELKFAEVVMAPTGERDDADYDVWGLKSVNLTVGGSAAVNITAPADDVIYLNGVKIGEEFITERTDGERDPRLPEDIPPVTMVTYEVTSLIGEATVTAIDKYGVLVKDIKVTDKVFYDVPYTYAEVTEEVESRALAAGEALAAYMQLDAPFGNIGQYVDPWSDLYTDLRTSDVRWANPHNGYGIENPSVTEYTIWSDTVYTCRVKFTHVLYRWDGNFENDFDTTFYYHFNGYSWLIYDSRVN